MTETDARTAIQRTGTRSFEGLTVPEPGTFVLDPFHTQIGFAARHLMVSRVRGQFKEFAGSITVAENPLQSSAEAVMKTASVDTGVDMRDNDLRSGNFFEAEKYPEITFRSTRVTGHHGSTFTVLGDLTIKDVTRSVELTVEIEGVTTRPEVMGGQQTIGFSITGEIDREDWGMTYNMALETGGFVVGKKVRLEIEGEAVRQG
jgi:polyisoprenoid-binding protein YceI